MDRQSIFLTYITLVVVLFIIKIVLFVVLGFLLLFLIIIAGILGSVVYFIISFKNNPEKYFYSLQVPSFLNIYLTRIKFVIALICFLSVYYTLDGEIKRTYNFKDNITRELYFGTQIFDLAKRYPFIEGLVITTYHLMEHTGNQSASHNKKRMIRNALDNFHSGQDFSLKTAPFNNYSSKKDIQYSHIKTLTDDNKLFLTFVNTYYFLMLLLFIGLIFFFLLLLRYLAKLSKAGYDIWKTKAYGRRNNENLISLIYYIIAIPEILFYGLFKPFYNFPKTYGKSGLLALVRSLIFLLLSIFFIYLAFYSFYYAVVSDNAIFVSIYLVVALCMLPPTYISLRWSDNYYKRYNIEKKVAKIITHIFLKYRAKRSDYEVYWIRDNCSTNQRDENLKLSSKLRNYFFVLFLKQSEAKENVKVVVFNKKQNSFLLIIIHYGICNMIDISKEILNTFKTIKFVNNPKPKAILIVPTSHDMDIKISDYPLTIAFIDLTDVLKTISAFKQCMGFHSN